MVTIQTRPDGRDRLDPSRVPRLRRAALPIGIGIVASLVDGIGAGIPSYWGDEAASVLSGTRPLPSLLTELGAVDAVHGLYYMLLHVWMWAFGTGEWATRALSVIAIGALAAGVVTLGRMWFGRSTAVVAGLLVAVIPRASSLAIETRGYAITAATAVWLVVLFTHLARQGAARRRWILFGVLAGVCSWFFVYLLLVPLTLCAVLLLVPRWAEAPHRNPREVRGDMMATIGSAFLGALPILALAALQRGQVSFLAHRGYLSPKGVLITPWFSHSAVAVVLWALIVMAVFITLATTRQRAQGTFALAWLTMPALALIAVDVFVAPTYNPRYLAVSLGAVALLAARGITGIVGAAARRLPRLAPIAAALIAVIVLGVTVPQYLHQRTPYAKDGGADFRVVADAVAQRAQPGDAVLFGAGPRPSRTARLAYRLYPDDFSGLRDPQLVTSFTDRAGLWDELAPVPAVASMLPEHTVWLLETKGAQSAGADLSALRRSGYALATELHLHRTIVYEFTRGAHHE
ncbi:mannosyltransferase [Microbacterium sp. W4I4]|uniref:glycosyltransferase family 39 protein n=1 Tax=Microbacterium sp. W4I4 TaxID=3042295 RepID=UPI002784AAE5|nr:glycosyltransferase family 39 protein [Microbacterium sp. W4I4]MDQ0612928.1 mannosyltransferase [Microbacterium sp. W4I4]